MCISVFFSDSIALLESDASPSSQQHDPLPATQQRSKNHSPHTPSPNRGARRRKEKIKFGPRRPATRDSAHFKCLMSWEEDLALGAKAKHGPILYAMDKLPEALTSDGMKWEHGECMGMWNVECEKWHWNVRHGNVRSDILLFHSAQFTNMLYFDTWAYFMTTAIRNI